MNRNVTLAVRAAAGAAAAGVVGMAGCRSFTQWEMDRQTGELYHFNWWNYYQRACQRLTDQQTAEALQDFEVCLGLRPGATYPEKRDMWRARTYGMHFLEGYFPNREAGICCYLLGQNDRAIEFLETSLRQKPSGRAKHYLNLARARHLAGRSLPPPTVTIASEAESPWTRTRSRTVAGEAQSAGLVRFVRINGRPLFSELAEARRPYRSEIPLTPGTNTVTVEAEDLLGRRVARSVAWIADWQPPVFQVRRVERDGAVWNVLGRCTDNEGLAVLTINGLERFRAPADRRDRSVALRLRLPAGRPLELTATDLAGNRLATRLAASDIAGLAAGRAAPPEVLLAERRAPAELSDAPAPLLAAALAGAAPAAAPPSRDAPRIELPDLRPVLKVFDPEFQLDGLAAAPNGLAQVWIAGAPVMDPSDRGALQCLFSRRLALATGTNAVEIVAEDVQGLRSLRRIAVIRRDPEYENEAYRLALALPPLVAGPDSPLPALVRSGLEAELLAPPARFHLLERGRGLDAILAELRLGLSDLADPRAAMRAGRLLAADLVLVGMLVPHDRGFTVYTRAVSADTGEILLHADVYSADEGPALAYQLGGLALKIEQHFPLLSGVVTAANGRRAELNLGLRDGASPASRFIVVAPDAPGQSLREGAVRRTPKRFVELRLRRVADDASVAEVYPASAQGAVKEGDYVYAR